MGVMTAASSVGGPLGQALPRAAQAALRNLVADLEGAGLQFRVENVRDGLPLDADSFTAALVARPAGFGHGITVSLAGPEGIDRLAVESLSDLQALEAFHVTGSLEGLSDPGLATALDALHRDGHRFFKPGGMVRDVFNWDDERVRRFGRYGAYKELTQGKQASFHELLEGPRTGMGRPLPSRIVALGRPFFDAGLEVAGLPSRDLACSLRTLEKQGCTFHKSAQVQRETTCTACDAWAALVENPGVSLWMGVHGSRLEKIDPATLADPEHMAADTRARIEFSERVLAPLVKSGGIREDAIAQALDVRFEGDSRLGLSGEECWSAVETLATLESVDGSLEVERALRDLHTLGASRVLRADPAAALAAFGRLLGAMPQQEAEAAFSALDAVAADGCSAAPALESSGAAARFLDLACAAGSADSARKAWDAAASGGNQASFEARYDLLTRLMDRHRLVQQQGNVLTRGARNEGACPGTEAVADFAMARSKPWCGEALEASVERILTLHGCLLGRHTPAATREAYEFLRSGVEENRFCGRDADQALGDFARICLARGDLELARRTLQSPPVDADLPHPSIVSRQETVTIAGICIPRRAT